MKTSLPKLILGYITICLIWGSTWLAIRIGLNFLTPMFSAGIRFLIASALTFIIIKFRNENLPKDNLALKLYFFMGIFSFALPFWLVYWGEQFVPSGLASILFGAFPFAVFIFSWFMLKTEELDIMKIISIILGFLGIVIIFYDNFNLNLTNQIWGLLAVLVSAIIQGFVAVVLKKYAGYLNPFSMNAYPLLIAGIIMISLSFITENISVQKFNLKSVLSILYLATFGTIVTFTIYYWLLQRMNVVILSLTSFITPIIAVFLGWVILSEELSENVLTGSVLVLIGILFANFKGLKNYLISLN